MLYIVCLYNIYLICKMDIHIFLSFYFFKCMKQKRNNGTNYYLLR